MRCQECGKSNPENSKICGTCGTKLSDISSGGMKSGSTNVTPDTASMESGTPTMIGRPANSPSWDGPVEANIQFQQSEKNPPVNKNINSCPKCGHYPLIEDNKIVTCPNCEYSTAQKNSEQNSRTNKKNSEPTQKFSDIHLPGDNNFSLTNIKTNQKLEFDQEEVIINRSSLESDSSSISREKHAVVTQVNGQWYIEDHSTHQATYVQVIGKVPLVPGTVILIGNQFYKFD